MPVGKKSASVLDGPRAKSGMPTAVGGALTEKALTRLDIAVHERYTFLDLGSGKGRILLQASLYPYKRIVGVEIAEVIYLPRPISAKDLASKLGTHPFEMLAELLTKQGIIASLDQELPDDAIFEVAKELSRRLDSTFLNDANGRRPVFGGTSKFQEDPHWHDCILFYEYFHGDNGAGIGASHQTGWTGIVAKLIELFGYLDPDLFLDTSDLLRVSASEPLATTNSETHDEALVSRPLTIQTT